MDVDPLYPLMVDYYVSPEIWQLFEIFIWQLVISKIGKNRTFLYMQRRYERTPQTGRAFKLMVTIITITYLILIADNWFKLIRRGENTFPNFFGLARQLLIPFPDSFRQRQVQLFNFGDPDDDQDSDHEDNENNDDSDNDRNNDDDGENHEDVVD